MAFGAILVHKGRKVAITLHDRFRIPKQRDANSRCPDLIGRGIPGPSRTMVSTVTSERLANSAMMDYAKMEWIECNRTSHSLLFDCTVTDAVWIFA